MAKHLTNAQILRKLAKLAEYHPFAGALLVTKIEELSQVAVDNKEELIQEMTPSDGKVSLIAPEIVIDSYQCILDIVKVK